MRADSMRLIGAAFAVGLIYSASALAADDSTKLLGAWRLVSYTRISHPVGSADIPTSKRDLYGANPKGNMILTPDGQIMVLITRVGEAATSTKAGPARLLSSMVAYFGNYKVHGNKLTITLKNSIASDEGFAGREQTQDVLLQCPAGPERQVVTECDAPGLYLSVRMEAASRFGMSVRYVSHWIREQD